MIRSVLAILAGITTLAVTSFAIEFALNPLMMRMFPEALPNEAAISRNLNASLFMFVYGGLCIALGGYVTAWIARRLPVRHALTMGVIQTGLNAMAFASMSEIAPLRNWIVGIALTVPAAWLGGVLRARHEKHAAPRPA